MNITVYCGGSAGVAEAYLAAGRELGRLLARAEITLVYGGASSGMMGAVAAGALAEGGKVIGVYPEFMRLHEPMLESVTQSIIVASMAERKAKLAELADGFMVLPGGIGTMEEFFEVYSARKLGLHHKPIVIINSRAYWNPLLDMLDQIADHGFTSEASIDLCHWCESLTEGLQVIVERVK